MGMCMGLCALNGQDVAKVLADPPLIWKVLAPDDPEVYEQARAPAPGFFARLFGAKPLPPAPEAEALDISAIAHTDLDKSWHGIHYMLTETDWKGEPPLNFLLLGGNEVGDIDVGYGTARAFNATETAEIANAISGIDEAWLRSRFNPEKMMKLSIYPEIWDRDPEEDDTFGYCAEYFKDLKEFIDQAVNRGQGLIIYVS